MFKHYMLSLLLMILSYNAVAQSALLIDVRSFAEYQAGHFPPAINIDFEQIGQQLPKITKDKNQIIYLYCRSGRRAEIARHTLTQLGYLQVYNLGGLEQTAQTLAQWQKKIN